MMKSVIKILRNPGGTVHAIQSHGDEAYVYVKYIFAYLCFG